MAATYTVAVGHPATTRPRALSSLGSRNQRTWHGILLSLTFATLFIQGYHPLSEDGGLYTAGIEYLLDPTLFPHDTSFVTAHLHYSAFAYFFAFLTRITHLPLTWALLFGYLASLWLTLYAAFRILRRCDAQPIAQLMGIAMLAAWATLPVAGTSLVLIDPYLTARSLSTPLSLLAIGFALDDWTSSRSSLYACTISLVLAATMHPLMAAYAASIVITTRILRSPSRVRILALALITTLAVAAALNASAPAESPAVIQAAISRYYWFLSQWQWFELLGLVGPIVVLLLLHRSARRDANPVIAQICSACLITGTAAITVALLFAHQNAATHLVARLQPLRIFLLIYAVMTILLAANLSQRLLNSRLRRPTCYAILICAFAANAGALFGAQRAIYPASQHLEFPGSQPTNPWLQAFLWIRANTPKDALFALDANYITQSGEDAQTFRATAQRSSLPDFSKDGGEAAITPSLANLWQQGVIAQTNLSHIDDPTRRARLLPLGVQWMVLRNDAVTQNPCPYRNLVVKVCQLLP